MSSRSNPPSSGLSLREQAMLRAQQHQQTQPMRYEDDSDEEQQQQQQQQVSNSGATFASHQQQQNYNQQQQYNQQHQQQYNQQQQQYPHSHSHSSSHHTLPLSASAPTIPTTSSNKLKTNRAVAARHEWRQYGLGVTQALEDKRQRRVTTTTTVSSSNCNPTHSQQQPFTVRVITAQERIDLAGCKYTVYVIRVQQHQQEWLVEHRYSDFDKLHTVLQQHDVDQLLVINDNDDNTHHTPVPFPAKHWAGGVGQFWTPSLRWAPDQHASLIQRRTVQLDVWLVHVVDLYHTTSTVLPQAVRTAIYDFFFMTLPKLPCQEAQLLQPPQPSGTVSTTTTTNMKFAKQKSRWNNPFSSTLGSAIRQATCTVQYMCGGCPDQSIPLDLLQAAQGLCFLTVLKAGLVVSGRYGTGLVVARLPDDNTNTLPRWSTPCAVATAGLGWGVQVGGDVTHYLIVLTSRAAVRDLVKSSSVQLGAELGVAVGPLGRGAQSALATGDWTLHAAYSYAHATGLFVGLSLEGSVVRVRQDINTVFYGQPVNAADLLEQAGPPAAEPLYAALAAALATEIPQGAFRPSELFAASPEPVAAAQSWKNTTNSGGSSSGPLTPSSPQTPNHGPSAGASQLLFGDPHDSMHTVAAVALQSGLVNDLAASASTTPWNSSGLGQT